jgi:hypothetical protein
MAWTMNDKVQWIRALGRVPHAQCKTVAGVLWECISYPYAEKDSVYVLVRLPGDPTTVRVVEALQVHPGEPPCCCAEAGEFYYTDPAWMAPMRAEEVAFWEQHGLSWAVKQSEV